MRLTVAGLSISVDPVFVSCNNTMIITKTGSAIQVVLQ